MGKKKQQKQSSPQDSIEQSEEEVKQKKKAKPKKQKQAKKAPAKASPKKQKEKSKPASNPAKSKKNGKSKTEIDDDQEQVIDKKKDFLPGQKYQTPDEDDGARAFYSSLYSQNPDSDIAKRYCLQYGLLEKDEAIKIQKQLSKKK